MAGNYKFSGSKNDSWRNKYTGFVFNKFFAKFLCFLNGLSNLFMHASSLSVSPESIVNAAVVSSA